VANKDGAARGIEATLGQVKGLGNSKSRPPQLNDQPAHTCSMDSRSVAAHHGDDFLHTWRIGRVAHSLVAGWAPGMGRGLSPATSSLERISSGDTSVLLGRTSDSPDLPPEAYRGRRVPSARSISLLHMSDDQSLLGEVRDPDGALVVLLARIWEDKIVVDHPELRDLVEQVLAAISAPDYVEADPQADRRRYYRGSVGPSKWLMVVVSFEQEPARIITALALRKDPRRWKP
jgi:hypothetical protein